MKDEELLKVFLQRVDVKGPDDCWEWKGPLDNSLHYGRTSFLGISMTAHRVAYILTYGEPLKVINGRKVLIRHICENRKCVNPAHLQLGTASENICDASTSGKHRVMDIEMMKKALALRNPIVYTHPKSIASKAYKLIAQKLVGHQEKSNFFSKLFG